MPKSGFVVIFLLIIVGALAAVSFLVAFNKIPIQIGKSNVTQEEVQNENGRGSNSSENLSPTSSVKVSPSTTQDSKSNNVTQPGSYSNTTQTNSSQSTTPQTIQTSATPTPTTSPTNPGKGKPQPTEVPFVGG